MDEQSILQNLFSGGTRREKAWGKFLDQYSHLFLKVIWQFEKDYDEVMEKYVVVCQKFAANDFAVLKKFRGDYGKNPPRLTTWLAAVTRNVCVDMHRRVHGRKQLPRSIRRLSNTEQLVFKLYYWNGKTLDEIRERLKSLIPSSKGDRVIEHVLSMPENKSPHAGIAGFVPFDEEVMGGSEPDYDTVDILTWLEKWLEELPPQERMILRLRFWEDMTGAEIAAAMHISPEQRVYPLITKALQMLREKAEAVRK